MSLDESTPSQDVGAIGLTGNAAYTNGVFTVTGGGADIQGSGDAFRFVYVTATGDCTIIARVTAVQNVNSWSKAGVMIRESLATNAADAFAAVTPGKGVTWQYRSSTGGNTCFNNTSGLSAPCWVKLVRSGNTFTGYRSVDGLTWTSQGTSTFTIASTVYVGLALTSHNNSNLCAATFDNLTAPNWSGPTPHIGDASITGGSLMFSSTNGLAGGAYTIWSSTNLSTSPTNWIQVGSGYFDGNGNFNISNSINAGEAARYYLLRQP